MASQPSSAEPNARKPPPPTGRILPGLLLRSASVFPSPRKKRPMLRGSNPVLSFIQSAALLALSETPGSASGWLLPCLRRALPMLAASDQRPSLIALSRSPIILSILLNSPIWVMKLLKSHFKDRDLGSILSSFASAFPRSRTVCFRSPTIFSAASTSGFHFPSQLGSYRPPSGLVILP